MHTQHKIGAQRACTLLSLLKVPSPLLFLRENHFQVDAHLTDSGFALIENDQLVCLNVTSSVRARVCLGSVIIHLRMPLLHACNVLRKICSCQHFMNVWWCRCTIDGWHNKHMRAAWALDWKMMPVKLRSWWVTLTLQLWKRYEHL